LNFDNKIGFYKIDFPVNFKNEETFLYKLASDSNSHLKEKYIAESIANLQEIAENSIAFPHYFLTVHEKNIKKLKELQQEFFEILNNSGIEFYFLTIPDIIIFLKKLYNPFLKVQFPTEEPIDNTNDLVSTIAPNKITFKRNQISFNKHQYSCL
jgi:hypothetical protein